MNPNELCIEMTSTKNTVCTDGICPTLTARMGTGGGQVNAVLYDRQKRGVYGESGVTSTLTAHESKEGNDIVCAVDCRNATESEVNGTLQAKENGGTSYNLNNVVRVKEDDLIAAGTQSQIFALIVQDLWCASGGRMGNCSRGSITTNRSIATGIV